MRDTGRQEQVIAGCECERLVGDAKGGFTLDEEYPFILRLNVLTGRDDRRADDSLNDQVLMTEERIEALSLIRRLCVGKEVVNSHTSAIEIYGGYHLVKTCP